MVGTLSVWYIILYASVGLLFITIGVALYHCFEHRRPEAPVVVLHYRPRHFQV